MTSGKNSYEDPAQIKIDEAALEEIREYLFRLVGPANEYLALSYEDYTTVRALLALEEFLKKRNIQPPYKVDIT